MGNEFQFAKTVIQTLMICLCCRFFSFYQDIKPADDSSKYEGGIAAAQLVQVLKKENVIEKSFDKLKEASTV